MQGMGEAGEACPFEFNFDPATFTPGEGHGWGAAQVRDRKIGE